MKENYYEILEIDKNASSEILEKAYKTLVKKYHPDLQKNNLKNNYEEKIKKINEAYEILSNPEKREEYNLIIKNNEISEENYNKLYNENINLKNEINYLKNNYINLEKNIYNNYNNMNNYKRNTNNFENNINKNYYNAYIQNLKNRKYKKNFKDFIALIITIFIIITVFFILWHIPFTKNYLINLYNNNSIIKFIIDLFINFFK